MPTATLTDTATYFAELRAGLNDLYRVTIAINLRIVGGTPQKDELIAGWLAKNLGNNLPQEELDALAARTAEEVYQDAEETNTTTFKTFDGAVCIEGRQVKAMLKEAAQRLGFGKAVKGERGSLKQDFHEALHVDEDFIPLMRDGAPLTKPDGIEERPIHVVGPQGPRTSIKRCAYVEAPATLTFTIRVLNMVACQRKHIEQALAFGQDLGLGADRSQGNGKFTVVGFEKIA